MSPYAVFRHRACSGGSVSCPQTLVRFDVFAPLAGFLVVHAGLMPTASATALSDSARGVASRRERRSQVIGSGSRSLCRCLLQQACSAMGATQTPSKLCKTAVLGLTCAGRSLGLCGEGCRYLATDEMLKFVECLSDVTSVSTLAVCHVHGSSNLPFTMWPENKANRKRRTDNIFFAPEKVETRPRKRASD